MKKVYRLEELDCAHCASKIEEGIARIDGVTACTVAFLTGKLTMEMEESKIEGILKEARKLIKRLEPDVVLVEK